MLSVLQWAKSHPETRVFPLSNWWYSTPSWRWLSSWTSWEERWLWALFLHSFIKIWCFPRGFLLVACQRPGNIRWFNSIFPLILKSNPLFYAEPYFHFQAASVSLVCCRRLLLEQTSRITFMCILCHLTYLNEDEKRVPRTHASLCHAKIPLQSVSELMGGGFLGLLDSRVQHLLGRSLLLHCESTELQHLLWRQDARRWCTHCGFNEQQQWAPQSIKKMRTEIFSHFVWLVQPHTNSCFPRLKGGT